METYWVITNTSMIIRVWYWHLYIEKKLLTHIDKMKIWVDIWIIIWIHHNQFLVLSWYLCCCLFMLKFTVGSKCLLCLDTWLDLFICKQGYIGWPLFVVYIVDTHRSLQEVTCVCCLLMELVHTRLQMVTFVCCLAL